MIKNLKTDAIVWKIDTEITINDTSVNVDNFVENGDFFCGQLVKPL